MKTVVFLFLCCIAGGYSSRKWESRSEESYEEGYFDDEGEYVGNPDDFAEIERPCQVYDLYCIRKFFASHAKCTIAKGPLSDPLYRSQVTYFIPYGNSSIVQNNVYIPGFSRAKIEEFYINKKTNKLVIAVALEDFQLVCPSSYFVFSRRGREPVVTVSPTLDVYPPVTLTAIIPNISDLQLDKSEVTAYLSGGPAFFFVPDTLNTVQDPQPAASLGTLIGNLPLSAMEAFLSEGFYYAHTYIQQNLCDFGLKVL